MPIDTLWVEGKLDAEVFGWVLDIPGLTIRRGGPKDDLAKRVRWDREATPPKLGSFFLRDRDFRDDAEEGRIEPYEERLKQSGELIGWHLCRHDIESYLIEPELLAAALKVDVGSIDEALTAAAVKLQHYAAARWVVGSLRPNVPFNYELETAPENLGEYQLPEVLDRSFQENWCRSHVCAFRDRSNVALSNDRLDDEITRRFEFFKLEALRSLDSIRYWFPGKNLLPAVSRQLGFASGVGDILPKLKSRLTKDPMLIAGLPEIQTLRKKISNT